MTQIRIDTEQAREVGQRLVTDSERLAEIGYELEHAINSLETWAWDGTSRWRAEPLLGQMRPESTRVAQELEELGRKLVRVADEFEQEDNAAARNLEGMSWVSWDDGGGAFDPPQSDLEKTIRDMIGNQCPVDPTPLLDAIHNASFEERQAILNDPELMEMFYLGLGPLAPAYVAALLEGGLYWPRWSGPNPGSDYEIFIGDNLTPQDDDDFDDNYSAFADWIRGEDEDANKPNTADSTMNCWEYVLFSTYLAGHLSYDDLVSLHSQAAQSAQATADAGGDGYGAYYDVFEDAFGTDDATAWQPGDDPPPAGSLIFFDDLAHVAISLGTTNPDGEPEIMSLWVYPPDTDGNYVHTAQRTTIDDVLDSGNFQVTYGPGHISIPDPDAGSSPPSDPAPPGRR